MQTRIRVRLAAISTLLILCSTGSRQVAAIDLPNDVEVQWSLCGPASCTVSVSGAPRRVSTRDEARDLQLHFAATASAGVSVKLKVFQAMSLEPIKVDNTNLVLIGPRIDIAGDHPEILSVSGFENFDKLPDTDLILTLELHVVGGARAGSLTVTLSGPGQWNAVDRVGDVDNFHPGSALDVPPRSTELVRALNQLQALRKTQAVELDAESTGAELAVGLTHAFDLPRDARIHGAFLTLRLTSGDPGSSSDFILLDSAVRNARQRRVPVIFLKHLVQPEPSFVSDNVYDFTINLRNVPISLVSLDDPIPSQPPSVDRAGDLEDGRLDVIVVGNSKVDFSELRITFDDLPG
jgi:hypothetical protein